MKIIEVKENKKQYLDLLLLADEQEDMVDRYLDNGKMYVLDDNGVKCECVITDEGNDILEIKNIATVPEYQGKGYARALIEFIVNNYREQYAILQVGTGDSPLTIRETRSAMQALAQKMQNSACEYPEAEQMIWELARELGSVKGKKSYGYLPKHLKQKIDAIVDQMELLPSVDECYGRWWKLQCRLNDFYAEKERQRPPLSQQKEFRQIKNAVIQVAEQVRQNEITFGTQAQSRMRSRMPPAMFRTQKMRGTQWRTTSLCRWRNGTKLQSSWKRWQTAAIGTRNT